MKKTTSLFFCCFDNTVLLDKNHDLVLMYDEISLFSKTEGWKEERRGESGRGLFRLQQKEEEKLSTPRTPAAESLCKKKSPSLALSLFPAPHSLALSL